MEVTAERCGHISDITARPLLSKVIRKSEVIRDIVYGCQLVSDGRRADGSFFWRSQSDSPAVKARSVWLFIADNIGNRKHLLRPFGRQPLSLHMSRTLLRRASQTVYTRRRTLDHETSISIRLRWLLRENMKHRRNLLTWRRVITSLCVVGSVRVRATYRNRLLL